MEPNITIFSNPAFGEVRTTTDESGNPLFSLRDVTNALDIKNQKTLKERLNPKGVVSTYLLTKGGKQQADFINEPNLYRCIFQSRKKNAIEFQDWVFEQVLPSIRNNGGYMVGQQSISKADFDQAVLTEAKILAGTTQKQLTFYKQMCADLQMQLNELQSNF